MLKENIRGGEHDWWITFYMYKIAVNMIIYA